MPGDTIRSMRLCAFVVIIMAGCSSDPTLSVTVTHPDGITVTKTTVTVYESTTVHCTDIEFARLDAAGLTGITTAEADIEAGSAKLEGISRLGTKIVVARGFDSGGLVSAGCVEHGDVTGDDSVAIATVPAATVSVHSPNDPTVSNGIEITLTDQASAPIADGRPVTWTVYGAAGASAANPANVTSPADGVWEPALPSCVDDKGHVTVHPNPPTALGGYAVQLRVAWAVDEPPMYTTLASPPIDELAVSLGITLSTAAKRPCAVRGKQLICVDSADQAHLFDITIANAKATATQNGAAQAAVPSNPTGQHVIALIAVPNPSSAPDVYAVSSAGDLVALFGARAPTNTATGCGLVPLTNCTDALIVPACGGIPAKLLLGNGSKIHQLDPRGGNVQDFTLTQAITSKLDNAGCITVLQDNGPALLGQFATAAVTGGTVATSTTHLINCSGSVCADSGNSLTRGAGVGFTGGTEPRIAGTTVDASGVVLIEAVIGPNGQTIERTRMAAASVPDRMVAGQFDADTDPDLFFDIAVRNNVSNLELGYARKVGNDNLEALSPSAGFNVTDLLVGDFNADGHDDVVVVTETNGVTGVVIVPFAVTLPAQTMATDPTCMP